MSADAEALLAEFERYVNECNILLDEGREAELGGMKELGERLSAETARLTPQQRKQHAVRLEALLVALRSLAQALQARRDEVVHTVQATERGRRANIAYRAAEASDNHRPEE